jgi:radical S-adenosyl methionine domain-containing protein 2
MRKCFYQNPHSIIFFHCRFLGKGKHLQKLRDISEWCTDFGVKFKLNSVINRYNHEEDFVENISCLNPVRWKCFQVLGVETENMGSQAIRDCSKFLITDEEFDEFCNRHKHLPCFVPESNRMMKSSYIILDEYMRFLSKGDEYKETKSILDGDLDELLSETDWEPDVFVERGGVYDWTKTEGCGSSDPALAW